MPGSPFPAGAGPTSLAFSPSGAFLAAGDDGNVLIAVFSVGSGGTLTQAPGSPFTTTYAADSVTFSPTGALLVTTDINDTVVYSVGPTGTLTQADVVQGNGGSGARTPAAFSPSGSLLAVAGSIVDDVYMYAVGSGSPALVAPSSSGAPRLTGGTKPGDVLTCSTGSWAGSPTSYSYSWYRNGTLLAGFSGATYRLGKLDEGSTFTCAVAAANAAGSASAMSNAITIPVPHVRGFPAARGTMTGTTIGQIKLGMTRSRARYLYRDHSNRGKLYEDFFCLTPIGVRVGYASPIPLRSVPKLARSGLAGRVVWASTSNPYYSLDGIRAGESIATAARVLGTEPPFHIGLNYWYLARKPGYTAVLKVRGSIVQELGIADESLTRSRKAQGVLMHSFY